LHLGRRDGNYFRKISLLGGGFWTIIG